MKSLTVSDQLALHPARCPDDTVSIDPLAETGGFHQEPMVDSHPVEHLSIRFGH
jgi:hypothetical protein